MWWALGIAVFSGMLGVTLFGIFLTPVFFLTILWLTGGKKAGAKQDGEHPTPPTAITGEPGPGGAH